MIARAAALSSTASIRSGLEVGGRSAIVVFVDLWHRRPSSSPSLSSSCDERGATTAVGLPPIFPRSSFGAGPVIRRWSSTSIATATITSRVIDTNTADTRRHHRPRGVALYRSFSTPSNTGGGGNESNDHQEDEDDDETKAMIDRWMRWNTSKTWKYEPNLDLISKIGEKGDGGGSPLDQFRDLVPRAKRETETVGRSWSVKELRRKSYDDLHKLWYVLYKEKNMLLTESNLARRHAYEMVQPDRRRKVVKSMGAIKQVLGERKRVKIADHKAYLKELERFEGLAVSPSNIRGGRSDGVVGPDDMENAMDAEAENLIPKYDRAMGGKE